MNLVATVAGVVIGLGALSRLFERRTAPPQDDAEQRARAIAGMSDNQDVLRELASRQRLQLIKDGFPECIADQMAAALYVGMLNSRS